MGQHLFTKQTVAPALMDQILAAWSPNLHVFTPHWEDGRDAMHIFSNPDFFFEHWRINIQRETMQRRATVDVSSVSQSEGVFGEELKTSMCFSLTPVCRTTPFSLALGVRCFVSLA